MAQRDVFRRYLEAGMAFTEMTRARAEAIVKDLVKSGDLPRKRAEEYIDDLVDRSRQNTEAMITLVQQQVREQLGQLGIATKDDIRRLEARIDAAGRAGGATKQPAPTRPAPVQAAPKQAAPKQAAKKAAGTSTAKRAAAAKKA